MRPIQSLMTLVLTLASGAALAQSAPAPAMTPTPPKPADSATYGPVLHPQGAPVTTQQAGEARPQAQEERAGQLPHSRHNEVDPSARPAPQAVQPQQGQQDKSKSGSKSKDKDKAQKDRQAKRRATLQRVESTPRIAAPQPQPQPQPRQRAQDVPAPMPAGPSSTQVVGCAGGHCLDTNGASYNAAGPGNAAVSSSGRLCNRTGNTMQCF
jgi:hypothetical protein